MQGEKIIICHIIHSLQVGGAELLLYDICHELKSQFSDYYEFIIIATNEAGPLKQKFEEIGIKVISLNLKGKRFLSSVWKIYKSLLKEKPDIVHTHLLPPDKYGQIAAFLAGIKKRISTVHNMEPNITRSEKISISIVKRFALKEIAVSESVKNHLVQRHGYNSKKIEVIYPTPSHVVTATESKKIETPVKIINLANLKEAKGQLFLIPAALEMQKISENFSIDIFGESKNEYGREVAKQIYNNKLEEKIILKGKSINPTSILPHYNIMISLSLWEGFGMSIVEGMCAGIPLILSDIPPHREILRNVEDFSFVRNSSPIEIAKIFKRLISDKSYYSYVSEKMIERSHDFSLQKMIAKYNAFYRSVSLNN